MNGVKTWSLEIWCRRILLRIPWKARSTNISIREKLGIYNMQNSNCLPTAYPTIIFRILAPGPWSLSKWMAGEDAEDHQCVELLKYYRNPELQCPELSTQRWTARGSLIHQRKVSWGHNNSQFPAMKEGIKVCFFSLWIRFPLKSECVLISGVVNGSQRSASDRSIIGVKYNLDGKTVWIEWVDEVGA